MDTAIKARLADAGLSAALADRFRAVRTHVNELPRKQRPRYYKSDDFLKAVRDVEVYADIIHKAVGQKRELVTRAEAPTDTFLSLDRFLIFGR